VVADTVMPGRTGYDLCQYIKMNPRLRYVRVILTAGVLEPLEDDQVRRVEADGALKKPFEASVLLATVKPLAEAATKARAEMGGASAANAVEKGPEAPAIPFVAVVDREQIRAAVTVALDASMDAMVEEITRRVVSALSVQKPVPSEAPAYPGLPKPLETPPPAPRAAEPVRRVSPLRVRSSILGLDIGREDPSSSS
jgi:response regulator RpfG family c-di-GMP phosphodiesterase